MELGAKLGIAFLGGAIVGFVAGYFYSKRMVEEVVKEQLSDLPSKNDASDNSELRDVDTIVRSAEEIARNRKYVNYSNAPEKEKDIEEKEESKLSSIRVIRPEEFGENEDYKQMSLAYYPDGHLYSDDDEIPYYKDLIGDALDHIGQYEPDAVHVVNDDRKYYYEILYYPDRY